jgi:F0F1-type ATP synthase membrane subunit a
MAKKKSDKEKDTESKVPSTNKFTAFFKNETIHFVIGLVLVIFSVYCWHSLPSSLQGQPTRALLTVEIRMIYRR